MLDVLVMFMALACLESLHEFMLKEIGYSQHILINKLHHAFPMLTYATLSIKITTFSRRERGTKHKPRTST